ncbi:hypothetical protein EYZ11_006442 [Aspergillus tanneri]|uniref:Amidase domain-containing protein n=1 Tax=Aspergillus tanneri TaxID=1220188 RepID=A0A4S3JFS9_9EURO|nr:hypothetical protein EYZ11_006442 [Aspergillus tanneri]
MELSMEMGYNLTVENSVDNNWTEYVDSVNKLHPTLANFVDNPNPPTRKELVQAYDSISELRQRWDRVACQYDAIITPSVTDEAPEGLGSTGSSIFNAMWTILHAPTLNIPCFFGSQGLPVGLTVVGGRYTDMEVLQAGEAIGALFKGET